MSLCCAIKKSINYCAYQASYNQSDMQYPSVTSFANILDFIKRPATRGARACNEKTNRAMSISKDLYTPMPKAVRERLQTSRNT